MSATAVSRASLEAAKQKLEGGGSIAERLALAEAFFRLAVLPDTPIEAGIELLRKAASCDPYHPKLFFHLGRLLHKNGDPRGAVQQYREGLKRAPRSHRMFVHLAMALNDLGRDESKLGQRMLDAIYAGDDAGLMAVVADLDRFGAHAPGEAYEQDAPAPTKGGQSRWRGIWKLFAMGEMSRAKPSTKIAVQRMEEGKHHIQNGRGVSEYALASLFFVLDGPKSCRQVESWLRDSALAAHQDNAAVRLVRATCELGAARNAEEFVETAGKHLESSELPPELVCCLHYCWYGTAGNDPVQAVELLDRYPAPFASMLCFRELRLSILDYHARAAWSADRVDRAEVLWRETIRLDPFRIPVAHNLAIAATRSKAIDTYASAWERAVELRYLVAAGSGDVRVELEDRVRLHRSFSQQAQLRYVPDGSRKPKDEELAAWMRDRDALAVWLRDGELAYLNSRLKFQSPVCLLGIKHDCSPEDAEAARDTLCRQFDLCFRDRLPAGGQAFLHLVRSLAERAYADAKDPMSRKRDTYIETEQAEAQEIGLNAFERGLLMLHMVKLAAKTLELKSAGLDVARFLIAMPWRSLEPLAKKSGRLEEDADLLPVFLSYVQSLALRREEKAKKDEKDAAFRVDAVLECIASVPESPELRLVLCQLLLDLGRNLDAYRAAVEALPLTAKMTDRSEAGKLETQFVICIDNAALAGIPESILSPVREKVGDTVRHCRGVLANFPRSGGLRFLMARYLIETAEDDPGRLKEAAALLEEGLDLLLTEKQVSEARQLLEKAGSRSKSLDAFKRIRALMESASTHARAAVAAVKDERTPAAARKARTELEEAIQEAGRAEEIAATASLPDAVEKARELTANLRKILEDIER